MTEGAKDILRGLAMLAAMVAPGVVGGLIGWALGGGPGVAIGAGVPYLILFVGLIAYGLGHDFEADA